MPRHAVSVQQLSFLYLTTATDARSVQFLVDCVAQQIKSYSTNKKVLFFGPHIYFKFYILHLDVTRILRCVKAAMYTVFQKKNIHSYYWLKVEE